MNGQPPARKPDKSISIDTEKTESEMKTYVIGDLQGCANEARLLLEQIEPGARILFVGDLINRGPDSLGALRRMKALSDASDGRVDALLGNHDLHLLAVAAGVQKMSRSDTLDDILAAPDRDALVDWLRRRPLAMFVDAHPEPAMAGRGKQMAMHDECGQGARRPHGNPCNDEQRRPRSSGAPDATSACPGRFLLVHAGVPPQWTAAQTMALAAEVETVLRGDRWIEFLGQMYGNEPDRWDDGLTGIARLRCIVNALTRMRLCWPDGRMDFAHKESDKGPEGSDLQPWFDLPGRRTLDVTVVFGHWSALGLVLRPNLVGLDSGCVWGGKLTAVCLDDRSLLQVDCPEYREHGGKK
jgi:bis(5'-nucleosyl)-tetraphosphatase (symmetrical)